MRTGSSALQTVGLYSDLPTVHGKAWVLVENYYALKVGKHTAAINFFTLKLKNDWFATSPIHMTLYHSSILLALSFSTWACPAVGMEYQNETLILVWNRATWQTDTQTHHSRCHSADEGYPEKINTN
jgi:hypothetical protein